jgi:hypothetical protein
MKALVFSKLGTFLEFQGTSSTAFSDHQKYDSFVKCTTVIPGNVLEQDLATMSLKIPLF